MPFMVAAIVLIGIVCALNLVFTIGVIRRLREHTQLLSDTGSDAAPFMAIGSEIGSFTTKTVDGEKLTTDVLGDNLLVGIFATNCAPCTEKLPKFAQLAESTPWGRDGVLAVVIGDPQDTTEFVTKLMPVARVVVETHGGVVSSAFEARAFPTILTIERNERGRLTVAGNRIDLDRVAVSG